MRTTHTSCLKVKRGVSTILGSIIFIMIIFTSILPMLLVMRQADAIYTRKIIEFENWQDERSREEIVMFVYPLTETSELLNVSIQNRGEVPIKVNRVWINDEHYTSDGTILSMESRILGPFDVSPQNITFYIVKVITDRGNMYVSDSGTLFFGDGTWYTSTLGISVFITNNKGKYNISVSLVGGGWNETYTSPSMESGDIVQTFEVEMPGQYTVAIGQWTGGSWVELPGTPVTVDIQWPNGTPIVYVYASGKDI